MTTPGNPLVLFAVWLERDSGDGMAHPKAMKAAANQNENRCIEAGRWNQIPDGWRFNSS